MRQTDESAALEGIAHMEQGRVVTLDSAMVWTQDVDCKALPDVKYFPKVNDTQNV